MHFRNDIYLVISYATCTHTIAVPDRPVPPFLIKHSLVGLEGTSLFRHSLSPSLSLRLSLFLSPLSLFPPLSLYFSTSLSLTLAVLVFIDRRVFPIEVEQAPRPLKHDLVVVGAWNDFGY